METSNDGEQHIVLYPGSGYPGGYTIQTRCSSHVTKIFINLSHRFLGSVHSVKVRNDKIYLTHNHFFYHVRYIKLIHPPTRDHTIIERDRDTLYKDFVVRPVHSKVDARVVIIYGTSWSWLRPIWTSHSITSRDCSPFCQQEERYTYTTWTHTQHDTE